MADLKTEALRLFDFEFAGNTGGDYITAFLVFVFLSFAFKIVKTVVLAKLKQLTERTENKLDDLLFAVVQEIPWSFYTLISLYAALSFLTLNDFLQRAVGYAIILVLTYYGVKILQTIIDFSRDQLIRERKKAEKADDISLLSTLADVLKIATWVFALILLLANFGYDVSALIAGLGIGGLAIALAAQNILEDIFASLSIYFDKPFKIGDFVIAGDDMGTVKKVGIKTTRIQTLQGQELIISNKELTSTRINNYGRMDQRRVPFQFGVVYGTSTKKLKAIPGMVKKIISGVKHARVDRVHFLKFGDFALIFEAVYYIDTSDYNVYMDVQQEINFGIKEKFEKEKIDMAFPTQTIYLAK